MKKNREEIKAIADALERPLPVSQEAKHRRQTMREGVEAVYRLAPDMPLQRLLLFLRVADNEGQTPATLAEGLRISRPAVSRHLAALDERGLGLLQAVTSISDARVRKVRLTPQGAKLLQ